MSLRDHGYKLTRALARRLDPTLRDKFRECAQRFAYKIVVYEGRVPKTQRQANSSMSRGRRLHGVLTYLQHLLGKRKKRSSSRRQCHSLWPANEQRRSETVLQLPNLQTQSWLRNMQLFCGSTNMAFLHNCKEIPEMTKLGTLVHEPTFLGQLVHNLRGFQLI